MSTNASHAFVPLPLPAGLPARRDARRLRHPLRQAPARTRCTSAARPRATAGDQVRTATTGADKGALNAAVDPGDRDGWAVQAGGRSRLAATDSRDGEPLIHVVFVHPQIHWNTGNIARTCLGLGARLHLVGPLGFSLDAKQIRRAGLDYWEHVDVRVHDSWDAFARAGSGELWRIGGQRYFFTKFGAQCATHVQWPVDGAEKIVLVFGSEVDGFDGIRDWLDGDGKDETRVAFPMIDEHFRSFNLSTTASMALWDAYKALKLAEAARAAVN